MPRRLDPAGVRGLSDRAAGARSARHRRRRWRSARCCRSRRAVSRWHAAGLGPARPLSGAARRWRRSIGLLTALVFSLWPLAAIGRIPAGALFRDLVDRRRWRVPLVAATMTAALAAASPALVIASAQDRAWPVVCRRCDRRLRHLPRGRSSRGRPAPASSAGRATRCCAWRLPISTGRARPPPRSCCRSASA